MGEDRPGIDASRLTRALRPAALGVRSAAGIAGTWARGRFRDADAREAAQVERMIRTAEQAASLMGEMKGAVMKLGQMLSFADVSALPPEFQTVLASLQADAPPMGWDLVVDVVRDELGAHPDERFERFSQVPIAAASIGQVHAATTLDGRDVVVKVQYPGVGDAIEADLRNTALLSALASLAKSFAGPLQPRTDVKAMAEELRDRVVEELDYRREAANQRRFAELWRDDPLVRIPEVDDDLSSRRVLTQAYHDGMRWAAAVEQPQKLRNRWAETIFRFVFTSLYRHHVFNADPHPGNYLFHEDGGVTFVDFGCVREFTPGQVDDLRQTGRAVVARDAERLVATLERAGWYPHGRRSAPEDVLAYITPGYAPLMAPQPFTLSRDWAAEIVQRQLGLSPGELKVVNEMAPPAHNLFLARISIGLFSVLTGLGATADWRDRFLQIEDWPELRDSP